MKRRVTNKPRQEDCVAIDDALTSMFGINRATILNEIRKLGIEKLQFGSTKYWIRKSDLFRLRDYRQLLSEQGMSNVEKIPDLLEYQAYAPTTDAEGLNLSNEVESLDVESSTNEESVSDFPSPPNKPAPDSGNSDAPSEISASDNEIESEKDEEQINAINNSTEAPAKSNSALSVPLQQNAANNSEIVAKSSAESSELDVGATPIQESRMEQINRQRDSKLAHLKADQRAADTLLTEETIYSHLLANPQDLSPESKERLKQKMLEEDRRRAKTAKKLKSDDLTSTVMENLSNQSSEDNFFGQPSTFLWDLE